jgi:hypothetical protein
VKAFETGFGLGLSEMLAPKALLLVDGPALAAGFPKEKDSLGGSGMAG